MTDSEHGAIDPEMAPRPCSLRQACRAAKLYRGGERCPDCLLRVLCQSELRWLVKTVPEKIYRC
jgi:hypothetical protein